MNALAPLLALARTEYLELTRQPVYGVSLAAGLTLVGLSPALAVFALGRAEALVLDLGASAVLFFAVFLAAAAVAASAAERLSDGTTALVLTHPVGPGGLLLGTFLGAAAALGQASLLLVAALLAVARNGPDTLHPGVVYPLGLALGAALVWGLRASLARQPFQPAALGSATVLLPLAYLLGLFVGRDGSLAAAEAFPTLPLAAGYLALLAALSFAALGLALAARLGPAPTAIACLVAFLLASLVRGPLGAANLGAWTWLTLPLPDLQAFWIGDAAYADAPRVPAAYLLEVTIYTALYSLGCLGLGAFFLQGRELGR